jgi:hypothetical protein
VRLLLHEHLNLLPARLLLLHDPPILLTNVILFVRLAVVLILNVRVVLVLLGLDGLLELLLHVLKLLLDFLQVTEECLLIQHPLLKTLLAELSPLANYLIIVFLSDPDLLIHEFLVILVALLKPFKHSFHRCLTILNLFCSLLLLELINLLPS